MLYVSSSTSPREAQRPVAFRRCSAALVALLAVLSSAFTAAQMDDPRAYLTALDDLFYLEQTDDPLDERLRNHLVPLGAIQKVRGKWAPRDSERISGERTAYTWRVDEGFAAADVVAELEQDLAGDAGVELLFSCEGISCGSSVQWANRVFGERVLYGTQDSQQYRIFKVMRGEQAYRLLIYASARTVDRQYVRAELLTVEEKLQ